MNKVTLKSCPFCGGEAHTTETARYGNQWGVRCGNYTHCKAFQGFYTTEDEAIEAWNTRAERTCHMKYQTSGMQRGWWKCSKCGTAMDTVESCAGRKLPKWCGNCGAKVVGE